MAKCNWLTSLSFIGLIMLMYSATDTTKFCRKSAQLNPINGTIVAT